ncbi:DUF6191 domain-containing protein [Nocardia arizonensis]|uniref:DUF6191 domain-containing protein n=1 Tax=Nocardia arizonensis TaxID=1141647 RepID=UPI003530F660
MGLLMAMTIPGLAVSLITLAFAEVLWNRLTGNRFLPWPQRTGRPVAASGFEEVAALFQGGKHHEFEQRTTALMHREDPGDGAPPRAEVDLRAGSATLLARDTPQPAGAGTAAGTDPDASRRNPLRS